MTHDAIQNIIDRISKVSIAVYGDFCLDAYWIMDNTASELSIETGLYTDTVGKHYYTPGGAGNVVANLAALRPSSIRAIGTVGNDIHGRELVSQLRSLGVEVSNLVIQHEEFDTYTYLKRHEDGREKPRVDFGSYNKRSIATDIALLTAIESALQECDALIFNQQVTNSISNESFITKANELFERYPGKIVMLDSRHFNERFHHVHRKVNDREISSLAGFPVSPDVQVPLTDVKRYGQTVFEQTGRPVFATCGDRGIIAIDRSGIYGINGVQLKGALDTVGAGDTVISALTLCLAAGVSVEDAAVFSNFAAAVTVQKLYTTGTASPEEIIEVSTAPDFIFNADLASSPRGAVYIPDTEFEICDQDVLERFGHIRHAVFDHDGTISSLRQGWEEIMEPVMMKSILGRQYESIDAGTYSKVLATVKEFIQKTTGIQTIYQMEGLVKLVGEFGFVPAQEILDKFQYKEIYNEGLMEMVNRRMQKLHVGELDPEDYTMKGAVRFLEILRSQGVTLYLASGTDVDDVRHEAESLGYASLFNGGIYGALRDYTKFSKRMVIEKIIKDNQLKGDELAVFGDGPDEIREGRRAGGLSIGIISDEVQRFGPNLAKRPRLVRAGAHLLIPDFSQHKKLASLLFQKDVNYADA